MRFRDFKKQSRGTLYVQLEDDVVTRPGFFPQMKTFALKKAQKEGLDQEIGGVSSPLVKQTQRLG